MENKISNIISQTQSCITYAKNVNLPQDIIHDMQIAEHYFSLSQDTIKDSAENYRTKSAGCRTSVGPTISNAEREDIIANLGLDLRAPRMNRLPKSSKKSYIPKKLSPKAGKSRKIIPVKRESSALESLPRNRFVRRVESVPNLHVNPQFSEMDYRKIQSARENTIDIVTRLDYFEFLDTIGTGSYGKVKLCKYKPDGRYFCCKMLRKQDIYRLNQVKHVQQEKWALSIVDHPGIVKLYGTCHDEHRIYFFLEYVPGGELFSYMKKLGQLPYYLARFYIAELVVILEYLHNRDIAYRDIKPENILLDSGGHLKLTDFGFAKLVTSRTYTMCGTVEYLAPEVFTQEGHDKLVDWWALGCLLYEMLVGEPPFPHVAVEGSTSPLAKYENQLTFPAHIPDVARNFMISLLQVNPDLRLGNNLSQVKTHPYFAEMDWNSVYNRSWVPSIRPILEHNGDTQYYNKMDQMDIQ
eukprot:TRINITY_DN3048_c0_g1_i3.p1 TRINITY_DN3048_c0_g1~~TRINITY_DN3048_c0_g1_i3.p1  ORF type:complete len:467 (-),score=94.78 TRINITY_DN3048_c0_g1_i3:88-1488(-)